jgi:glucosamine--fructose-6-phosphate aminotransferase (isomerizing)
MTQSNFAILHEMQDAVDLARHFDPRITTSWRERIATHKKLLLTGEGSSRIFPARNIITQALQQGTDWTIISEGARQAQTYNLDDFTVIGASNSGQTKELVSLFTSLQNSSASRLALTAQNDSAITHLADDSIILSCGPEKAVAATKSVIEQALILQSLLGFTDWDSLPALANIMQDILDAPLPDSIISTLSQSSALYFSGAHDGVAEELTLKSYEITRKRAAYLEGTYVLHGIEEVLQKHQNYYPRCYQYSCYCYCNI